MSTIRGKTIIQMNQPVPHGQVGLANNGSNVTYASDGFTGTLITDMQLDIPTSGGVVMVGFTSNYGTPTPGIARGTWGPCGGDADIEIRNEATGAATPLNVANITVAKGGVVLPTCMVFFDAPKAGLQKYRVYRWNNASLTRDSIFLFAVEL